MIGQGATATVWHGTHQQNRRQVAIKILGTEAGESGEQVASLLQETRLVARVAPRNYMFMVMVD